MSSYTKHTKRTTLMFSYTLNDYNWVFRILPTIQINGFNCNKKSFGITLAWLCFDLYFWFTWTKWFAENK